MRAPQEKSFKYRLLKRRCRWLRNPIAGGGAKRTACKWPLISPIPYDRPAPPWSCSASLFQPNIFGTAQWPWSTPAPLLSNLESLVQPRIISPLQHHWSNPALLCSKLGSLVKTSIIIVSFAPALLPHWWLLPWWEIGSMVGIHPWWEIGSMVEIHPWWEIEHIWHIIPRVFSDIYMEGFATSVWHYRLHHLNHRLTDQYVNMCVTTVSVNACPGTEPCHQH